MDKEVWRKIVSAIRSADRVIPRTGRRKRYSDQQIVKMYLWSVWHDRPLCWACQRSHYHHPYRPKQLPSVSQFCRRVQALRIGRMLEHVHRRLAEGDRPIDILSVDGKALAVSDYSGDPDAATGYGCGRFQRGYKLHACVSDDDRIPCFQVHPMNTAEQTIACDLLDQTLAPGQLVLGDSNYDSSRLYRCCDDRQAMMLTPLKGRSRQAKRRQQMPTTRLNALRLWEQHPALARTLLKERDRIERVFATLCGVGEGLKGLPAWVRTLPRVRRWVTGKIIFYHARLDLRYLAA